MTDRDQTDTNEMATTETKYQTNFYTSKNTDIKSNFIKAVGTQFTDKITIKCEIWDINTKYLFGIGIFWYTKFLVTD